MNVAEAKRGMVRTEADEAGEEGRCQYAGCPQSIMMRILLCILKATERVSFHLDQHKSSAFSPLLLTCPHSSPEPFSRIYSVIWREGGAVTISECRWAARPLRVSSIDRSLRKQRDASEKCVSLQAGHIASSTLMLTTLLAHLSLPHCTLSKTCSPALSLWLLICLAEAS